MMRVLKPRERSDTEEDFETTEGEEVDLYDKLMEMDGWTVSDEENQNDLTWYLFDDFFETYFIMNQ